MKTLYSMLSEIYNELDKKMYDELSDYEKGMKDILNLLDCRMSGNDEEEMFNDIMEDLVKAEVVASAEMIGDN